jgi:hypothetical protein
LNTYIAIESVQLLKGAFMKPLVLAVILFLSVNTYSHFVDGYAGLYGAFSFPLGEFGDDDEFDNSGMAGPGLSGGISYSIPLAGDWLQLMFDGSVLYHGFDLEKTDSDPVLANVNDLNGGRYFLFPILCGIKGACDINYRFRAYGLGQLGFSSIMETGMEGDFRINGIFLASGERTFENAVTFAFAFGGGVVIADKVILGVRYLNCGEPDIDYTTDVSGTPYDGERDFQISVFQLLVGVEF